MFRKSYNTGVARFITTNDNGIALIGTEYSGYGRDKISLIVTNAQGDALWKQVYGIGHPCRAIWLRQTSDSGYILLGRIRAGESDPGDFFLNKTNSSGYVH